MASLNASLHYTTGKTGSVTLINHVISYNK